MNKNLLFKIWLGVLGVILAIGAYLSFRIVTGHGEEIFHADDNLPWTLLIATYIFFVLTSTGATLIAAVPTVFGVKQFEPLVKRSIFIGIITLMAGFVAMGLELGNPINMVYYFLTPNLSSPIWWMGLFYMMLLFILMYKFYRIHEGAEHGKIDKILAVLALLLEVAALSTLGSVFGLIEARPTFFGEYIQVYFFFTAIISGASAILFFSLAQYKLTNTGMPKELEPMYNWLARILGGAIGFTLILSIWRILLGLYSNRPEFAVLHHMINSIPYKIEIFVGLLLPFALMIIPSIRRTCNGKLAAAVLLFIGLGIGRMNMIMLGQLQPVIPKNPDNAISVYFPSWGEWMIALFALAIMLFLYTIGEKYMKLETQTKS